ncbi:hypothetical protein Drorol1_Dr00013536 [Drosera rotundifolia]
MPSPTTPPPPPPPPPRLHCRRRRTSPLILHPTARIQRKLPGIPLRSPSNSHLHALPKPSRNQKSKRARNSGIPFLESKENTEYTVKTQKTSMAKQSAPSSSSSSSSYSSNALFSNDDLSKWELINHDEEDDDGILFEVQSLDSFSSETLEMDTPILDLHESVLESLRNEIPKNGIDVNLNGSNSIWGKHHVLDDGSMPLDHGVKVDVFN